MRAKDIASICIRNSFHSIPEGMREGSGSRGRGENNDDLRFHSRENDARHSRGRSVLKQLEFQGLRLTAPKSSEVEVEGAAMALHGQEAVLALLHGVHNDPAVVPREDEPEPVVKVNAKVGQQAEDETKERISEVEDE